MYQNLKRTIGAILFVLLLVMFGGMRGDVQAGDKNPCGKNPCSMKNPCGKNPCGMKNPCAANPCAMKPKPIRKTTIKDSAKLMAMGEKLWVDTKLGSSGLSCGTCHPDGKGLKMTPFPKYLKMPDDVLTLDQMINFCMKNPMKGKALAWNSLEITALAAYVQSHAKEESEPVNPCSIKNPCGMKNPCGRK